MHKAALGHSNEFLLGMADGYTLDSSIGESHARGFAYGQANLQTVVQFTGGTLAKALALHLAAVLPRVSHSINLDDQYEDDIARERIPVIEGFSPIPEGAGLGIDVDEEVLERVATNEPTVPPRHIGVIRLPNAHKLHTSSFSHWISHPDATRWVNQLTGRGERAIRGITMQLWDDDGSTEFNRAHERAARQLAVDPTVEHLVR